MRTGQVIGSTDRQAGQAKDRPVSFQEIFATLYHNLGIDPAHGDGHRPDGPAAATWSMTWGRFVNWFEARSF